MCIASEMDLSERSTEERKISISVEDRLRPKFRIAQEDPQISIVRLVDNSLSNSWSIKSISFLFILNTLCMCICIKDTLNQTKYQIINVFSPIFVKVI